MKTYLFVILFGLFGLFGSTTVLAHNTAYVGAYAGVPFSGGITIWGDSYGRTGYAGNVSLGIAGGYANPGYAPTAYYGHVHGRSCGHKPRYGYARGYKNGYRHGKHNGHHHGRRH